MGYSLYPDEYVSSAYEIDFEAFYALGYRGIIFDIDNTLVPHGEPADARAIALFQRLKDIGFQSCLLSNNKEPRVAAFNAPIGTKYIYKAGKPKKEGYGKALDLMGTAAEATLFVGDQIFTDLAGAKNAGLYMVLVKPINPKEEIQIVLKRIPEKLILATYYIYRLFVPETKHRLVSEDKVKLGKQEGQK